MNNIHDMFETELWFPIENIEWAVTTGIFRATADMIMPLKKRNRIPIFQMRYYALDECNYNLTYQIKKGVKRK